AAVAGGVPASAIVVYRNGVAVPNCSGPAGVASPDPCVAYRETMPDGNVRIGVLTSSGSVWAFGTANTVSVGAASVVEGDTGNSRSVAFPVTLTTPPTAPVTVRYAVQGN